MKFLLAVAIITLSNYAQAQEIKPSDVTKIMKKVADWH